MLFYLVVLCLVSAKNNYLMLLSSERSLLEFSSEDIPLVINFDCRLYGSDPLTLSLWIRRDRLHKTPLISVWSRDATMEAEERQVLLLSKGPGRRVDLTITDPRDCITSSPEAPAEEAEPDGETSYKTPAEPYYDGASSSQSCSEQTSPGFNKQLTVEGKKAKTWEFITATITAEYLFLCSTGSKSTPNCIASAGSGNWGFFGHGSGYYSPWMGHIRLGGPSLTLTGAKIYNRAFYVEEIRRIAHRANSVDPTLGCEPGRCFGSFPPERHCLRERIEEKTGNVTKGNFDYYSRLFIREKCDDDYRHYMLTIDLTVLEYDADLIVTNANQSHRWSSNSYGSDSLALNLQDEIFNNFGYVIVAVEGLSTTPTHYTLTTQYTYYEEDCPREAAVSSAAVDRSGREPHDSPLIQQMKTEGKDYLSYVVLLTLGAVALLGFCVCACGYRQKMIAATLREGEVPLLGVQNRT